MKKSIAALFAGCVALTGGLANAESFEDTCLRVSAEWGTEGDVPGQCSCLADAVSSDAGLEGELLSLAETYSNDEEAYDAGSDAAKAVFDSCSVDAA